MLLWLGTNFIPGSGCGQSEMICTHLQSSTPQTQVTNILHCTRLQPARVLSSTRPQPCPQNQTLNTNDPVRPPWPHTKRLTPTLTVSNSSRPDPGRTTVPKCLPEKAQGSREVTACSRQHPPAAPDYQVLEDLLERACNCESSLCPLMHLLKLAGSSGRTGKPLLKCKQQG